MNELQTVPSKVFITGASGFIGRALARRYRELGAMVAGVDFQADEACNVVAGDITRPQGWRDALQGSELVIHTAALVSNTATMDAAWAANVKATSDLLAECVAAGVDHFIQLSSVAAYGFEFTRTARESDPLRPMGNTYVDTKIASEHSVLACHASGALDCTVIRPTDVYGPGSRPWIVLPLQMMIKGRFLLPAHGCGIFSPVYIDDLVEGIVLAGIRRQARGQIFNIGDGSTPTCEEFFGYHARMLGRNVVPSTGTVAARLLAQAVGSITRLFGGKSELGRGTVGMLSRRAGYSIDKARDLLGYQPAVGLDEGMQRTRAWVEEECVIPATVA